MVPGCVRYLSARKGWRLRRKTGELIAVDGVVCPDRDGSAVVVRARGASKDVRVAAQVLLAMLDDLVAATGSSDGSAHEIAVRARELCAFALVGAASTSALLVADDPVLASRIASELAALGLALEIVSSATSALAILETRGADLVVVTTRPAARMLPLMREAHPGIPVIVVGGTRVALAEVVEALDHARR